MQFLRHDDRGATAIEYAVIGALIGIGLIGSLVGTKTSLSAIFGVASSQMGSATGSTAAAPAVNPRAPFWQGKTLSKPVVYATSGTLKIANYTYSDGTNVNIARDTGVNPNTYELVINKGNTYEVTTIDANGHELRRVVNTYTNAAQSSLVSQASTQSASDFNGLTPTSYTLYTQSNGSSVTGAPPQSYLDANTIATYDNAYFSSLPFQ